MEIMSDGINADRHAEDYRYEVKSEQQHKMKIHLAAGGGFAAILTKSDRNLRNE